MDDRQRTRIFQKPDQVEVLAPGGSLEGLRGAVAAGADAVYMGGRRFGARAYADNPEETELLQAIDYCHLHGRKLYLTVNTLLKERELSGELYDFMEPVVRQGVDAVLVQDFGVLAFLRREFPQLPIHASTQMSVQSVDGALFLKERGVTRIVPARELSVREVRAIYEAAGMEIECFVHGALCYCYSGQCLMSSLIGGRSGNRGRCAQPCRQTYVLEDESGKTLRAEGKYLLSLKDICTLECLPDILDAGVCSLKIEGRMKRPEYAAGVTEIYRKYVDRWAEMREEKDKTWTVDPEDVRALQDLYNRGGFSSGYYYVHNAKEMMTTARPNHIGTTAARAEKKNGWFTAQEDLFAGDVLETDVRPGNQSSGITLKEDIKKGTSFRLPVKDQLREGRTISRVRCEKQLAGLRERYLVGELKEKIKGKFILHREVPAILSVTFGECSVRMEGQIPSEALSRPATPDSICRQLLKTGQTPFVFEDLQIEMDEGLFLPMPALNELRREALAELEKRITGQYRREDAVFALSQPEPDACHRHVSPRKERVGVPGKWRPEITCSVQTPEQLKAVLSDDSVNRIYVDAMLWMEHPQTEGPAELFRQSRPLIFLMLPPVWRADVVRRFDEMFPNEVLALFDGFVLRHADQIRRFALLAQAKELVTDYGIYVFNREAYEMLRGEGIRRVTLSAELNAGELSGFAGTECELIVYGRYPVMISAQCLRRTTLTCLRQKKGLPADAAGRQHHVLTLTDRKGVRFPVRTLCSICTNIIYNSLPVSLHDREREIERIRPRSMRFSFTFEDGGQVRQILANKVNFDYTRGHFARGVE